MQRNRSLFVLAVFAAFVAFAACMGLGPGCRRSASPPSQRCCLLITIDTCRTDALSGYPSSRGETPFLDGLAEEGVRFDRCLTPAPITLPSHCSLFSGLYPAEHGVRINGQVLSDEVPTLAEILASKGVATAGFVGAYVLSRSFGLAQGFDVYDEEMGQTRREGSVVPERTCFEVNAAVRAWMRQGVKTPFFLWVHYFDPHAPHEAPLEYMKRFPEDPYFAEVALVDDAIEQLVGELKDLVGARGLLIAIVGDHGEGLGDHGEKEHGLLLYDETVKVPLILNGDGLPRGRTVATQVGLMDLYPTLQEWMLGGSAVQGSGVSLWPMIRGRATPKAPLVAMESLMGYEKYGWSPASGCSEGGWSLISDPKPQLYDLTRDPGQTHDLSAQEPDRVRQMSSNLKRIRGSFFERKAEPSDGNMAALKSLGYVVPSRGFDPGSIPWDDPSLPSPSKMIDVVQYERRGLAHWQAGDREAAKREFEAGLQRDPQNIELLNDMGLVLMEEQRWSEACAWFQRLTQAERQTARGWVDEGLCRERMGEIPEAILCYDRAVKKDPQDWKAWFNGARCLAASGAWPEAKTWAEQAKALSPTEEAVTRLLADIEAKGSGVTPRGDPSR